MEYRPDDEHDAVCNSNARHQLIVAPPGTGKTHLSIRLAAQRVLELPPGARVLLLTFSNQARTQLEEEAVQQIKPELRKRVEVSNYHRFFWHAVRAFRRSLNLPMDIDIGSARRRKTALERIDREAIAQITRQSSLIDCLAEHRFDEFQDERTPGAEVLMRLLDGIRSEQDTGSLVFDDLGALFWELIKKFPTIGDAYRRKYPVVIADEHQDASGLQDAIVREFGSSRLTVFADPMQLIHGYRGARADRLEAHQVDCDQELTLSTPHRWHGQEIIARWLLSVRAGLSGQRAHPRAPESVRFYQTDPLYGAGAVKSIVRNSVARAFHDGESRVAVLTRTNDQANEIRNYLCRKGLYPRQVGGLDFEDARTEIEQLPLLNDPQSVAIQALARIAELAPTLSPQIQKQIRQRLEMDRVRTNRAGADAAAVLVGLARIYEDGRAAYFKAIHLALEGLVARGHYLPRQEAVSTIRSTASAIDPATVSLGEALNDYSARVLSAAHTANRPSNGLYVMTVHQAKGKEFGAVIICDVSSRFYPDNEESRKLLYVAVTRASSVWTIIAPSEGGSPLLEHLGL